MTVGEFFDEYNLRIKEITDEDIDVEDYDLCYKVATDYTKIVTNFHINHLTKQLVLEYDS